MIFVLWQYRCWKLGRRAEAVYTERLGVDLALTKSALRFTNSEANQSELVLGERLLAAHVIFFVRARVDFSLTRF